MAVGTALSPVTPRGRRPPQRVSLLPTPLARPTGVTGRGGCPSTRAEATTVAVTEAAAAAAAAAERLRQGRAKGGGRPGGGGQRLADHRLLCHCQRLRGTSSTPPLSCSRRGGGGRAEGGSPRPAVGAWGGHGPQAGAQCRRRAPRFAIVPAGGLAGGEAGLGGREGGRAGRRANGGRLGGRQRWRGDGFNSCSTMLRD